MTFRPWKPAVPEVLRKRAPAKQSERVHATLRAWHLSIPGEADVERLFSILEEPEDGSLSPEHRELVSGVVRAAVDYREALMDAFGALR